MSRFTLTPLTLASPSPLSPPYFPFRSADDQRDQYEQLFYMLQTEPRYLGKLPSVLRNEQIPPFIQTCAFTIFGDQYSEREEFLLLSVFRVALEEEFAQYNNLGSLLRGTCFLFFF